MTAAETAKACARSIRDPAVRRALAAAVPRLTEHSEVFYASGDDDRLHETLAQNYQVPGVSDDQMRAIYGGNLVRASCPGRKLYDRLVRGMCAYCRHGHATTLDHFVPKTLVGGLSIEPWNLVPCCSTCNHRMGSQWSTEPSKRLLHPYFVGDVGRWLRASVVHQEPPSVEFSARPESSTDPELADRIRNQFRALNLGPMFSEVCAPDLSTLEVQLTGQRFGHQADISAYLSEVATAALAVDCNARRGVLHEALASDEWYINRFIAVG